MRTSRLLLLAISSLSLLASAANAKGVFLLQLGSFDSEAEATQQWEKVKNANSEALGGLSVQVSEVTLQPDNEKVYRTQAGPVATRAEAAKLCAQIKSKNGQCFVVESALFNPPGLKPVAVAQAEKPSAAAKEETAMPADLPASKAEAKEEPKLAALPALDSGKPAEAAAPTTMAPSAAKKKAQASPSDDETRPGMFSWIFPGSKESDEPASKTAAQTANDSAAPAAGKSEASVKFAEADTDEARVGHPMNARDRRRASVPHATQYGKREAVAPKASMMAEPLPAAAAPAPTATAATSAPAPVSSERQALIDRAAAAAIQGGPTTETSSASMSPLEEPPVVRPAPEVKAQAEAKPEVKGTHRVLDAPKNLGTLNSKEEAKGPAPQGRVEVAEAVRVPVSSRKPATAHFANAATAATRYAYPSQDLHTRTLWAQLASFPDEQAALNYWDSMASRSPDLVDNVRVRVTHPYGNYAHNQGVSLRVGPYETAEQTQQLCAAASRDGLRCGTVSDLGTTGSNSMERQRGYRSGNYSTGATPSIGAAEASWIQFGSYHSQAAAEDAWRGIQSHNRSLLRNRQSSISPPPMGSHTTPVFRLRAGPFKSGSEAATLCGRLAARGVDCIMVTD